MNEKDNSVLNKSKYVSRVSVHRFKTHFARYIFPSDRTNRQKNIKSRLNISEINRNLK